MNKKDLLELKRRFKKDESTFTRVSGCFVDAEKNIILKSNDTFLNLEEEDYFKYLEIAKRVLSGTLDNNLLKLSFSDSEAGATDKQMSLIELKKSKLKDDEILDNFYETIIDSYDYPENYLILVFHDVYDVITKTTDNLKLDESEEVFEYVICAVCPVSLTPAGLSYFEDERKIKSRLRDWIVELPINGFLYPAFTDRSADVNSLLYYTKDTKDIQPEFVVNALGCDPKETITIQKEKFQTVMKDSVSIDEDEADEIYMEIQDSLNTMVEDYKASAEDPDDEPIILTKNHLQNVLIDSGIDTDEIEKIERFYDENFNESLPSAENLLDKKILKLNEQKKVEKYLQKEVESLRNKLEEIDSLDELTEEYDIILQAKPDKINEIKSQIIEGQEYLMIPINEDEKTKINEIKEKNN